MKTSDVERLLREELRTVTGCTEPAAIAYAVQCAKRHLSCDAGRERVRVALRLSPEVLRNASTAVVPGIGRRGIRAAVVAGLLSSSVGFDPFAGLRVPRTHPLLSRRGWLAVAPFARRGIYIRAAITVRDETVTATVAGRHDCIVSIEKNGRVRYRAVPRRRAARLNGVREIEAIVRRRSPRLERIALDFIARQVKADPGTPLEDGVAGLVARRMLGRPLPVVTVTGSGNQGIFLGVPLHALHRRVGRRALPAVLFSLLAQIHLSRRRKRISDVCGLGVKAAPALAAGLAYARGDSVASIGRIMAEVHDRLKGMPCRGAEPGCGAKAVRALRCVFAAAGNPAEAARNRGPAGRGTQVSRRAAPPSRLEIERNHARLLERNMRFRKHGYDFSRSIRFVLSHALPLSGAVLEIGTGKGRFLSALAAKVSSVTTVDISRSEQRFARLNAAWAGVGDRIRFMAGDVARLGFRDGTFDAVISMNALHHFSDPVAAVRGMARLLRPGGRIVLSDLDASGYRIFDRVFAAEGRAHARSRFRFGELADCLRGEGLRVRRFRAERQELLIAERNGRGGVTQERRPQ